MSLNKIVCLTFDVEDWFQLESFRSTYPISTWNKQELERIEKNTENLLNLLDEFGIKATFFVLGWTAERKPELIDKILKRGHEIASHGYFHIRNSQLSKKSINEEIYRSKFVLERISGKIFGYRAPTFSISDTVMNILIENGFIYDSSLNNFTLNKKYGKLNGHTDSKPFLHSTGIFEFPLSVLSIRKLNIPISGGGYFRILPLSLFTGLVNRFFVTESIYIFYIHPWEVDKNPPVLENVSNFSKFRHFFGTKYTYSKLKQFIGYLSNHCEFKRLIDLTKIFTNTLNK